MSSNPGQSYGSTSYSGGGQGTYLYQQYINFGLGTVYTYWGGWLPASVHYFNDPQSAHTINEVWGVHEVTVGYQFSGQYSSDAY